MTLSKSQIGAYLKDLFAKINGLRSLAFLERFAPKLKMLIADLEAKATVEEQTIAAQLPETFTPTQLVDVLFGLAETWFPAYAPTLKMLQVVVDALLSLIPTPAPAPVPSPAP